MTRLLQYGLAVLTAATLAFIANATPSRADGKILNYVVEYSGEDMVSRTDYIYLPTGLVGEKIVQRTNPNNEGALENSEREVYGYDDAMVQEAAVQAGPKRDLWYWNSILKTWNAKGLRTVHDLRGPSPLAGAGRNLRVDREAPSGNDFLKDAGTRAFRFNRKE